jgi:hypothetical protein
MKYCIGDYIVYGILDELYYAVIKNSHTEFLSPSYITIQTLYSFFAIYDDGSTGLSPISKLPISYIKGKVQQNLTKQEVFATYPEYML